MGRARRRGTAFSFPFFLVLHVTTVVVCQSCRPKKKRLVECTDEATDELHRAASPSCAAAGSVQASRHPDQDAAEQVGPCYSSSSGFHPDFPQAADRLSESDFSVRTCVPSVLCSVQLVADDRVGNVGDANDFD